MSKTKTNLASLQQELKCVYITGKMYAGPFAGVFSGTRKTTFSVCVSMQPVSNADFIVPVEIEGIIHQVYVLKRPHCDEFLRRMGEMFECILFTASLAKVCVLNNIVLCTIISSCIQCTYNTYAC